ncbi:high-affinity nickel-transport family protein [Bordetella holmesii 30539]|uniref:Nickel/cobalt efflux system n=1 Tax=Bordetella holmesii 1058 TaxID=1247648 RepID=A0ABN0S2F4_9BORD|nr:high-affinity nickel-transport family protein [Bordetella holmesii ATCC 51541]AIT25936.1 high-affinity nickel-transport family protein [Bordetella holmesii 44057]EWM41695.1 high-affinity nickel-transport family protein [Bordetella holmesii 41130]EWM46505.1 high-affinity nickel-transport family protein [Bordetella holmesii 35009]EWM50671.1 high-affinity nickel-transport family protein [Bordetella holmesii 70147]EXF89545.1 high-affinity nickel-transport family protein [Bordetella holmesii 305
MLTAALLLTGASAWAQSHPFAVPESAPPSTGWLAQWFAQISVWQSHFYRQLTAAVRAWQHEGSWVLVGLSFAYGVFHALGPGHGKAVISAFVLANHQSARNGAILALMSALLQAVVAILMVAILAGLFNVTAHVMNAGTQWLELASHGLIVVLGAWLVWAKALRPWFLAEQGGSRHLHHATCGCGHVPPLALMAGRLDWRRAWTAIAAVGLRPCSGALIVLVFALSQGIFSAGVVAAMAMGLGTGLTVAVLAMIAVWSRDALTASSRLSPPLVARLRYAVEALAALAVLLLGILLLGGQIASGG